MEILVVCPVMKETSVVGKSFVRLVCWVSLVSSCHGSFLDSLSKSHALLPCGAGLMTRREIGAREIAPSLWLRAGFRRACLAFRVSAARLPRREPGAQSVGRRPSPHLVPRTWQVGVGHIWRDLFWAQRACPHRSWTCATSARPTRWHSCLLTCSSGHQLPTRLGGHPLPIRSGGHPSLR